MKNQFSAPRLLDRFVLILVFSLAMTASLTADISLPKIFSDNMVLQRNASITIWGKAKPKQKLVIQFIEQKVDAIADDKGDWQARIVTGKHGGPFKLEIGSAENGGPKVVFSNVMVGEVWLCSGQSNMEWPMTHITDSKQEIEGAKDQSQLRLFSVVNDVSPVKLDEFSKANPWAVCNSETVRNFSAVAYFFGRELNQNLDGVPIGLIDSTWGGTPAEAWTSRPTLDARPELAGLLKFWDEKQGEQGPHRPASLFNAMIAPLEKFRIQGAIWYQGESNNGRGVQYLTLLPTLIDDWRTTLNNPKMPFYFVQIAPFRYDNRPPTALPEIWDAQLKTMQKVADTGMIVTTDIADFKDIHPGNKQDVGKRLAQLALGKIYSQELSPSKKMACFENPVMKGSVIDSGKMKIEFLNVGEGLQTKSDSTELKEFLICGNDKKFVPANAMITGKDSIVVWADDVTQPVAVRFCWKDTPEPNLFNSAGLPASPFRTDDFPLESANVDF